MILSVQTVTVAVHCLIPKIPHLMASYYLENVVISLQIVPKCNNYILQYFKNIRNSWLYIMLKFPAT